MAPHAAITPWPQKIGQPTHMLENIKVRADSGSIKLAGLLVHVRIQYPAQHT